MNKAFFIVLFVTIFYSGVVHASPTKETVSELTSTEKHPVTVAGTTQPVKVESKTPAPEEKAQIKETAQNSTTTHAVENDGKNITANSTATSAKITGQVSDNVAATNVSSKPLNDTKILPATAPVTNATDVKPANATTVKPTTDTVPVNTEMPRPIPSETNKTSTTTLSPGTTTKAPDTKPTAVTSVPVVQTVTDSVTIEHNSTPQGNRFDGASFVGGIVLTIGLTAIGFIAFKYYKAGKIDTNYRTL